MREALWYVASPPSPPVTDPSKTSCNLPGFSLTLLLLPRTEDKPRYTAERILELIDAPAEAPGWKPFRKVLKEAEAYVQDKAKVDKMKNGGKAVPSELQQSATFRGADPFKSRTLTSSRKHFERHAKTSSRPNPRSPNLIRSQATATAVSASKPAPRRSSKSSTPTNSTRRT